MNHRSPWLRNLHLLILASLIIQSVIIPSRPIAALSQPGPIASAAEQPAQAMPRSKSAALIWCHSIKRRVTILGAIANLRLCELESAP
jgi:hypothetical protein